MASGLLWFTSPDRVSQQFSTAADEIGENTLDIAKDAAKKGADRVRDVVWEGGENPTQKGGPRVKSHQMVDSVNSRVDLNGRGRVQGEFGFIDNPPEWARWQDAGTKNIPAMLAMAAGFQVTYDALDGDLRTGKWLPAAWR